MKQIHSKPFVHLLFCLILVAGFIPAQGTTQAAQLYAQDFQLFPLDNVAHTGNTYSSGWVRNTGTADWRIVQEGTLPDGTTPNQVVKHLSDASTASFFAYDGLKGEVVGNATVSAKMKMATVAGARAGILGRYSDGNNYYLLSLSDNKLELRAKQNGTNSTLLTTPFVFNSDSYYTLRLTMNGSTLTGSVDGGPSITVEDTKLPPTQTNGRVGFYSGTGTTVASFDDIVVNDIPQAPVTATLIPIVSVTDVENDGNVAQNMLDDKLYTRWSSSGDGQPATFDLGSVQKVGYVGISFYNGNLRTSTFDLELSVDGTNWTKVLDRKVSSGTTIMPEAFDFADTDARYVRFIGHGNSAAGTSGAWNSITTFQVYAPCAQPLILSNHLEIEPPPAPAQPYTKAGLYNPDGTSATIHTPNPVTGTVRNVVDFGADPADNANDDAAAIRAALAAAQAGDEVYFPDGVYNLKTTMPNDTATHFELKTKVNLRGQSQDGAILSSVFDDGVSGLTHTSSRTTKGFNKNNIMISNLTFTSTWNKAFPTNPRISHPDRGGPKNHIYLDDTSGVGSSYITIDHVTFERFEKMAVRVSESNNVVVKNSLFRNATDIGGGGAGYGVSIQGTPKTDQLGKGNDTYFNLVENNRFEGPYIRHGALLQYYAHNNLVRNNVFESTVYDSIDLHGEDEYLNEIVGNTIRNTMSGGGIGVGNTGGTAPTNHDAAGPKNYIHNNTISGAREGIILYMGSPDTVVENNIIENTTRADSIGIIVRNAPGTILKDNIIRNNTGDNFWAIAFQHDNGDVNAGEIGKGDPSNVMVEGNTLTGNTNGITVEAGTGIVLRNNTINSLGTNLAIAPGTGVDLTEQPVAPNQVIGLQAQAGDEQVALNWSPSDRATSYMVLRANGENYQVIATGLTSAAYTDVNVSIGQTYNYKVIASNAAGESSPSQPASASVVNLFTVGTPVLKDSNGNVVNQLDLKSNMSVEVSADNQSINSKPIVLLVQLYDKKDRKQDEVIVNKLVTGGQTETLKADIKIPNGLGHEYELRVNVYNSLTSLQPLTQPVTFQ